MGGETGEQEGGGEGGGEERIWERRGDGTGKREEVSRGWARRAEQSGGGETIGEERREDGLIEQIRGKRRR